MMKSNYKHCHSKQAMIETNEMKIFREKSSVKNKMQQNKIDRWKAEEESQKRLKGKITRNLTLCRC